MPRKTQSTSHPTTNKRMNGNGNSGSWERQKNVRTMLPMRNGMTDKNRRGVIDLLNLQLADHYILVTKTKFYHWNVEGPEFHDIHELLDEHYEVISEQVDLLAEQCLKLGGQAAGTLAWFKDHARLGEDPGDEIPDTMTMIKNLLNDHETIMTNLHEDIKATDERFDDAVTSNLLQDFSMQHHRMAWMLRMIAQPTTLEAETSHSQMETVSNGKGQHRASR